MAAAYAFGRGRKVRPGAVRAGKEGRPFAVVGRWKKTFLIFFVDRGAAFWQCAFLPRGCSSVGRALEWHSRGQEFNSPQLHQKGNQGLRKRRPFFRFRLPPFFSPPPHDAIVSFCDIFTEPLFPRCPFSLSALLGEKGPSMTRSKEGGR